MNWRELFKFYLLESGYKQKIVKESVKIKVECPYCNNIHTFNILQINGIQVCYCSETHNWFQIEKTVIKENKQYTN